MDDEISPPVKHRLLRRWWWVILAALLSLPYALAAAALGELFMNPIGGPGADLHVWGTLAWAGSGVLLTAPAAVVPGPRRRDRVVVGLIVAAAWFGMGRYLLPDR